MKEDSKSIKTSKESFDKQLLQQKDETGELTLKLKSETELGMKQKTLSKENQDKIIRLNELRESLGARAGENERTISCLKEDIKELETSKEDFDKQLLEQRDETGELTVKLKTEIDSGNKLKKLLKENQDEITRLNESGIMSKVIEEEKERTISFLTEDIKGLETSK